MGDEGDLVATRLARGCRCFAIFSGDSIAGYGWLSTGPEWIGELELTITALPGEGYIWNCVTLPEHRRKGVFRSLIAGICEAARREGRKRIWIGSVAIPAERAVAPSGFKPALRMSSRMIAGMCWLKVAPADGAEPELVEAAREVLAVGGRPLRLATTLRRSNPRRH